MSAPRATAPPPPLLVRALAVLALGLVVLAGLALAGVVGPDGEDAAAGGVAPDRAPVLATSGEDYRPGTVVRGRADLDDALAVADTALARALTYDHRALQETVTGATELMTTAFAEEFRTTFAGSAAVLAREQQAVTQATVRAAGVVRTERAAGAAEGRVLCLLYLDQLLVSSETAQDPEAPVQVLQARVLVGVVRTEDGWRVDSIDPF